MAGLAETKPPSARPSLLVADVRAGVIVLVALAALGVPAGLLWALLAPRGYATLVPGGALLDVETKAFFSDDVTFGAIGAAAGLLCGIAAWLLARRHGVAIALGLAAGGLAGSVIARAVGHAVTQGAVRHWLDTGANGSRHAWFLEVRATPMLLAWSFFGVAVVLLLTAFLDYGEPAPDPKADPAADSAADPAAESAPPLEGPGSGSPPA